MINERTEMICIDASVLVAHSLPQDYFHESSRQFVRRVFVQNRPRCAPVLVLPECAGPVARRTGDVEMGDDTAAFVERFFGTGLRPLSLPLGKRAGEIAARLRLRGADSVYVATADTQDATLVTWDREMLDRGAAVVKTRTPKQWIEANARSE